MAWEKDVLRQDTLKSLLRSGGVSASCGVPYFNSLGGPFTQSNAEMIGELNPSFANKETLSSANMSTQTFPSSK